jgi:cytochrome c oxidase subunit 3
MATTLEAPSRTGTAGGDWQTRGPKERLTARDDRSPEPSRTGIWVGLGAITMTFAAFTSALIVSQGSAPEWQHLTLPPILYINTLVLLFSSFTLEIARRKTSAFVHNVKIRQSIPMAWLCTTLILGLLFVAGQYYAWLRLKSEGIFLATTLSSSFFYVLTAMHALHVLGGLTAMILVIRRFVSPVLLLRKSTLDATSYYWHFMSVLWLYLLWILWIKL